MDAAPMRSRFAILFFLCLFCFFPPAGWTAEQDVLPRLDPNDPAALQEAIRLLEDEIKLAARPQTYIVIDLVDQTVVIKGRGVELHRFPIERWSAIHLADVTATYRLLERPLVIRRKIDPTAGAELPPISLDDMPTNYTLQFSPSLTVTICSSTLNELGQWLALKGQAWWSWVRNWSLILTTGNPPASVPTLQLTVSADHAQSLAWTTTKDMAFLVRRTASPSP